MSLRRRMDAATSFLSLPSYASPARLALAAGVAVLLALLSGCGSGGKQSNGSQRPPAQATVQITPLTPGAGDGASGPLAPGQTPRAGFALASPTAATTCTPSDLLRLVDKQTALPADYAPLDLAALQKKDSSPDAVLVLKLRRAAEDAMHRMLEQARAANIYILAQSTYRSYDEQGRIYQAEVTNFGQPQAERESARQGHSEHQLGLAVDFTTKGLAFDLNESFAATAEGTWLQQNAAQFGFVLSYPRDKEAETGYMYEPWHYRYLGVQTAQTVLKSGLTLNQWLATRQLGCAA